MSSPSSDKQSKGKSKKASMKSSKSLKAGKEGNANVDKFRGEGVNFKCKLLGVAEVDGPRGDSMCIEALKKLKVHQRQSGEHKMKIILNVSLMGIRILEDKTKNVLFEHPVNKVSFITHDPDDKKIFSFISSAKCSEVSIGHMMYAIKYDKLAGMITSTLYDLFQAVFKVRQEAALKQRKAQREPAPTPPTSQNCSTSTSQAGLSNGPSEASNIIDNNIYEEPSASSSNFKEDSTNDSSHYKVPAPRPLPPAPYSSTLTQVNTQTAPKENNGDSTPNQANVSSSSDNFFSSSVFSQPEQTADNVSELSFEITRKTSISSSISSTSETASHDAKSLASATPPAVPRGRHAISSLGGHAPLALEQTPVQEDDDNYETIPSCDYETIPPNLLPPSSTEKPETKPVAVDFAFKESFNDESFPFEVEKKTNGDPFASPDNPEPSLTKSEGSPLSSAVFGNDDFFSSAFDDKVGTAHAPTMDFPVDDPFAPTSNTTSVEANSADPFASCDAFESAFETTENVKQSEQDASSEKAEKPEAAKSEVFDAFGAAFGTTETSPAFGATEMSSEFKATEKSPAFGATEMSIKFKEIEMPIEFEATESKDEVNEKPKEELSWSNAFEDSEPNESNSDNPKADIPWSAAFGESERHHDQENGQTTKNEGSKVSFAFDDSFGADLDGEKQDNGPQPDKVAVQPDLSWTNAFNDKSQKEVTFSWDDAFGQPDTKDGHPDTKDGQPDTKNGHTDSEFDAVSFNDAFASTPFKPTESKIDSEVKVNGSFPVSNIAGVLTPIKPGNPLNETSDKKEETTLGVLAKEGFKEESPSESAMDGKAKLAVEENSSDSDKDDEERQPSHDFSKLGKLTIPKIIEPTKDDDSDAEDEPVKQFSLPKLPNKTTEDQPSPTAPPPLPPRQAMAPLPSLPPRPRTSSSPIVGQIPPTPPRPMSAASSAPKSGIPKRLPPALPPRIDLVSKTSANSPSAGNSSVRNSDPFGFPKTDEAVGNKNSWEVQWPEESPKDNEKQIDSNSKKSPDPFGDDFFTDLTFTAAPKSNQNGSSNNQENSDLFADPFVSKEGGEDMFKADFGGADPFAEFSSNSKSIDPFASDGGDVFSGFSTGEDPFADSVDPFADKISLNDPFAVSPKKNVNEKSMSFELTKNESDDDFADSFA